MGVEIRGNPFKLRAMSTKLSKNNILEFYFYNYLHINLYLTSHNPYLAKDHHHFPHMFIAFYLFDTINIYRLLFDINFNEKKQKTN